MRDKLIALWVKVATKAESSPLLTKALHTFWQAAVGYGLEVVLVSHAPLSDWHAVAAGAIGAGLSALKTLWVAYPTATRAE